jgi:hypothetical protein
LENINIHNGEHIAEKAEYYPARHRQLSIQGCLCRFGISFLAIVRMPVKSRTLPEIGAISGQRPKRIDSVWAKSTSPL